MSKGYQSYRGRRSLGGRVAIVLLVLVLVAACGFIFVQRYISYTDDGGIYLDLPYFGRIDLPSPPRPEEPPAPEEEPPQEPPVNLVIDQPEEPEEPPTPEETFGEHRLVELGALPADASALADVLDASGANGFVYTVRNDKGEIFWASPTGQKKAVKGDEAATEDLRALCGLGGTTAVARFNVLHDSYYAAANMKDAAICQPNGYVWYDNHSWHWLDAEKEMARQYVTGLAVECAQLGFDELLLEELCYPGQGKLNKIDYSGNTMEKSAALALLLGDLRTALEPYGTKLSLLLTEEDLLTGSNEVTGVDLGLLLPLVDGVYAQVSSAESAQAILDAAVGEGEAAPVLVPLTAETGEGNWCMPAP